MKAMNVNNVTHCTDDNYRFIMIQGAGEMLINIVPSYSLSRLLNKQKEKKNSIKTGVYIIKQSMLLLNKVYHYITSNLINK